MRISDTLAQLAAKRPPHGGAAIVSDRLAPLDAFGANPGALGAWSYVPRDLPRGAPLVVVLHGCTQTAAGYDQGTGWSTLAERAGFALLFPEQRRANNMNLCFNWFETADIAAVGGEAESIASMIETMVDRHDLDEDRVFVTGLSAGGAMAAVMLATYPDRFAGGAIIGGLPYGGAPGVGAALDRMAGRDRRSDATRVADVDAGSRRHSGRWPTVSIWHGTADQTVVVDNLEHLAAQWRGIHGIAKEPTRIDRNGSAEHRSWVVDGRTVVETWQIAGMGHGVPIDPAAGDGLGAIGPYMLASGIDSTATIARSWGLVGATERKAAAKPGENPRLTRIEPRAAPAAPPVRATAQNVIESALRAAGLMR